MESLGADVIIDYIKQNFTNTIEKYDYVFDAVGKSSFSQCKPILRPDGVYISSEPGPFAQNIFYTIFTRMTRKKVILPIPYNTNLTIPFIIDALRTGEFMPVIDKQYAFSEISTAYKLSIQDKKQGMF